MIERRNCVDCARPLESGATRCPCGWRASISRPAESPYRRYPSWDESKSAYERVKDKLKSPPMAWTRERFIEHYNRILANPSAVAYSKNHAQQALKELGVLMESPERMAVEAELSVVREKMAQFREPGSDDEDDPPLDDFERELMERANP